MSGFKKFKTFANSLNNFQQTSKLNSDLNNSHSTNIQSPNISIEVFNPNDLLSGTNLMQNYTSLYSPTNSETYDFKPLLELTPKNNGAFLNINFPVVNSPKSATNVSLNASDSNCDVSYKTEMCRTWIETGVCPYNEKCRFAHGKKELHDKVIVGRNYKQKECKSFHTKGFCNYGSRCHFKHEQRRLPEIERSFYNLKLNCESTLYSFLKKGNSGNKGNNMRLPIFKAVTSKSNSINRCLIDNNSNKLLEDFYESKKLKLNIINKFQNAFNCSTGNKISNTSRAI